MSACVQVPGVPLYFNSRYIYTQCKVDVGRRHEDQHTREDILLDDVVPDEVSVSLHTEREDLQYVREKNCILRGVCRERG